MLAGLRLSRDDVVALFSRACLLLLGVACLALNECVAQTQTDQVAPKSVYQQERPPQGDANAAILQKAWVVKVVVNGRPFGVQLALERDGRWWLSRAGSQAWGLKQSSDSPPITYRGQSFVPVDTFGANNTQFDSLALILNITFDPSELAGSGDYRLSGAVGFAQPTLQSTGGFVNYDLVANGASRRGANNEFSVGAEFEVGAFSPLGSLVSSLKAVKEPRFEGSPPSAPAVVRKTTTYRIDWPERMWTLEVGDSTGKAGIWGRPALFGGLNFHTNFLTRPGFITYPQPSFSGAAVVPSTATVFIDNVRRANLGFAPGPFGISNIPVISGDNEVSLVVRDSLGRETIMRQQFYSSLELLKPGLHDFALEAGMIRQNFGLRSFDYKKLAVVGQSRYGWSEKLTAEARLEQIGQGTTLGVGAIVLVPIPAIATIAIAASQSDGQSGTLILAGLEKRTRDWAVGIRGQSMSAGFTQLGVDQIRVRPQHSLTAYGSTKLGRESDYGSFGFVFVDAGRNKQDGGQTVSATWSKSFVNGSVFYLSTSYANHPARNTQVSAALSYPLGRRTSVSASASRNSSGAASGSISAATALKNVDEIAWRARISGSTSPAAATSMTGEATLLWRAPMFDSSVGVSVGREAQGGRIAVSGAVGMADGTWFRTRTLYDGFGIIRTPGMNGIPIMSNGRVVAVSDRNGIAVVSNLTPYQENTLRVDLKRLPLNIDTDNDTVVLVPRYRSATSGEIKLFRTVSAMLSVTTGNGVPVPLGTEVSLIGSAERFVVGRAGRLYLAKLQPQNTVVVHLDNGDCTLSLDVPTQYFSPQVDGNHRLQLGARVCK